MRRNEGTLPFIPSEGYRALHSGSKALIGPISSSFALIGRISSPLHSITPPDPCWCARNLTPLRTIGEGNLTPLRTIGEGNLTPLRTIGEGNLTPLRTIDTTAGVCRRHHRRRLVAPLIGQHIPSSGWSNLEPLALDNPTRPNLGDTFGHPRTPNDHP